MENYLTRITSYNYQKKRKVHEKSTFVLQATWIFREYKLHHHNLGTFKIVENKLLFKKKKHVQEA